MRSARSKVMAVAGCGLAVAAVISGCGDASQQVSSKGKVSGSFNGLENAKSAAFAVTLDTTVADLAAISAAEGSPMSASDRASVGKLIGGKVLITSSAPAGKTFGDLSRSSAGNFSLNGVLDDPAKLQQELKNSGSSSFAFQLSGGSVVEFRSVNGLIYVKADVPKVLQLAGEPQSELTSLEAQLPASMASLKKALAGQWVSIDLAKAAQALKSSGLAGAVPTPSASPTPNAADVQQLIEALKAAYQQNATISTIGDEGDKGTHYRLSAPAKQIAEAVQDQLVAVVGKASGTEIRKGIAEMPAKTYNLDLWVKNDDLSAVSLDLTQFLKKPVPGKKLSLDVAITENPGAVSAPSGATELDLSSLISSAGGLIAGGLGGTGSTSSGSGTAPALSSTSTGHLTKAEISQLKAAGYTNAQIKQLEGLSSSK